MSDIGSFISSFLNILISGVSYFFDTLDSITFAGISLLDYSITLFLLSVVIPLIFTLMRARRASSRSRSHSERRNNNEE